MNTLEECLNATVHCHSKGTCILQTSTGVEHYGCNCLLRWDAKTNCSINFHQEWSHHDTFLWVTGLIGFSLVFLLFLVEIFFEVMTKTCLQLWKMNFVFKLNSLFAVFTRISTLSFWAYFSLSGLDDSLLLVDQIIFNIGNVASFAMYYGVILMWVAIVSRLTEISRETTEMFRKSRSVVLSVLAANVVVLLTFGMMYAITSYTFSTYVYYLCIALFLLVALCWSSFYVVRLFFALRDLDLPIVKRKNTLIGIVNIFGFMLVVFNFIFLVIGAKSDSTKYLVILSVLRFTEMIFSFFVALTVENYLLLGKKKLLKEFKKGWAYQQHSSSSSGSPMVNINSSQQKSVSL